FLGISVVLQSNKLAGRYQFRIVSALVKVRKDEVVIGRVKDVQLAAQIIECRCFGAVGHYRYIPERLAVILDGHTARIFGRQTMTRFALVELSVRLLTRHNAPAARNLDISREPTEVHCLD